MTKKFEKRHRKYQPELEDLLVLRVGAFKAIILKLVSFLSNRCPIPGKVSGSR